MNILVVDDEALTLKAIEFNLKNDDHNVTTCSDGFEAIKYIQKEDFDLIISDIAMPNINGLEVLNYAKSKLGKKIPVILVTALDEDELFDAATKLGTDDFIVKPIDMAELLVRVERFDPKHN